MFVSVVLGLFGLVKVCVNLDVRTMVSPIS